jgi:hypothetical protein
MLLSNRCHACATGTLVGIVAASIALVAATKTASAQEQQVPATPAPTARPNVIVRMSSQQNNLQALLDKVVWDPAQRGPLLIIAPEKTTPYADRPRVMGRSIEILRNGRPSLPEPDANGNYRLADLGDYFGRRVRPVGKSLTVFAPTTMSVLPTRLPAPDPYAGMGANEKLRLFQSTLTSAQWRAIGSPNGIGVSDLDGKQRDLFLSLLPDPFVVQPVRRTEDGQRVLYIDERSETATTLTSAQRRNVRLSMRRVLDWYYVSAGSGVSGGRTSLGGSRQEDGASFELRGNGFGSNFNNDGTVFGLRLLEEVPNRLKAGHLPFEWSALDASVPLGGATTVGELVKRAATQTRLPLFCDPRYAELTVYMRTGNSSSVRAGDLLEALCWAVTGTFRKVSDSAYIMTDDIEGLGTRHARLQEWMQASAALTQQRRNEVQEALAKASIGDYVGWTENDTNRPDDALSQQIEAHRKKMSDPNLPLASTPAQRAERDLLVPVSALPATAQSTIRQQLENHKKQQEQRANDPFLSAHPELYPPLQSDRVGIDTKLQAAFVVPGMGMVSAQGSGFSSDAEQSLIPASARGAGFGGMLEPAAPSGPLTIPSAYTLRALLVSPQNAGEAERAIATAKAHGMNQVWIEVTPALSGEQDTSKALLPAAIAAGKKANISVGAVVRLLRLPPGKGAAEGKALPTDRNIRGETATEWAARRVKAPFATTPFNRPGILPPQQEAERLQRLGDWLLPDDPAVQAAVLKRVAAIAQLPGLAGLVLRDTNPPGYTATTRLPFASDYSDAADQMGYTEAMRLAFLREASVDPIDLSPLASGNLAMPMGMPMFGLSRGMALPFFPDYGPHPGGSRINGQSAAELGAKDAPLRWERFRTTRSEQVTQSVLRTVHTKQPELKVWIQRGADDFSSFASTPFFDVLTAGGQNKTPPPASPNPREAGPGEVPHSPQALLTIRCAPFPEGKDTTAADGATNTFTRRLTAVMTRVQQNWGGIVIDLSQVPLERALPLLENLKP